MVDFPNEIRINPAIINKLIVGGVVVLLVGFGVTTSFYKVDPREEAIVLRLGRPIAIVNTIPIHPGTVWEYIECQYRSCTLMIVQSFTHT